MAIRAPDGANNKEKWLSKSGAGAHSAHTVVSMADLGAGAGEGPGGVHLVHQVHQVHPVHQVHQEVHQLHQEVHQVHWCCSLLLYFHPREKCA